MATNAGFHNKHFDSGTRKKLSIYNNYIKSAVPVFMNVSKSRIKSIHIYDFFSGPGHDANGNWGSPLLAIETVLQMATAPQTAHLWGKRIYFHFFDRKRKHIDALKNNIELYFGDKLRSYDNVKCDCLALDFATSFQLAIPEIRKQGTANILFIDQFGMAHFDVPKLVELSKCYFTDCLLFMASSSLHRFKDLQDRFTQMGYKFNNPKDLKEVHSKILEAFKKAKKATKLYFGSFAFQKKYNNIYGLIYFSGSKRGIDKFLRLCWKEDPHQGMADFFLHDNQPNKNDQLLFEFAQCSRIEELQKKLRDYICKLHPDNEKYICEFCYDEWLNPPDCAPVITSLKKEGIIKRCAFTVPQPDQEREILYI